VAQNPWPERVSGDGFASLSDEQLFEAVRRGSEAHFTVLYERYFQRIYAFLFVRVRNHADAEELTQETFTAVFRFAEGYGGRATPLAWVYGVAKNTVLNHLRRRRIQDAKLEQAGPEVLASSSATWTMTPEEHLTLDRCAREIDRTLASVSDWQAEAFHLRHVENLTIGEIAARMERSNDAVRSGLYRVKRALTETELMAPENQNP
jgi:RNA polymerase sigma-70 factor (ECF subfamily)